jgi:ATP-dependent Clp protease adaptor protein ClpS
MDVYATIRFSTLSSQDEDQTSRSIVAQLAPHIKEPSMYRVILLNDDFTPMEYVVDILKKYFNKDHTTATEIMLNIHTKGKGVCGIYSYDIAETKAAQVIEDARSNEYPLQCTLEKV